MQMHSTNTSIPDEPELNDYVMIDKYQIFKREADTKYFHGGYQYEVYYKDFGCQFIANSYPSAAGWAWVEEYGDGG